jgi:histidine phosphotransfer protein HptB
MTKSLIDTSVFKDLSEAMGAEFAVELVNTFLSDAPNMIAELKDAMAGGDADTFRRAAHSIKSNAEVFGASMLADQARSLELGGLPCNAASVPDLETTYGETETADRR